MSRYQNIPKRVLPHLLDIYYENASNLIDLHAYQDLVRTHHRNCILKSIFMASLGVLGFGGMLSGWQKIGRYISGGAFVLYAGSKVMASSYNDMLQDEVEIIKRGTLKNMRDLVITLNSSEKEENSKFYLQSVLNTVHNELENECNQNKNSMKYGINLRTPVHVLFGAFIGYTLGKFTNLNFENKNNFQWFHSKTKTINPIDVLYSPYIGLYTAFFLLYDELKKLDTKNPLEYDIAKYIILAEECESNFDIESF